MAEYLREKVAQRHAHTLRRSKLWKHKPHGKVLHPVFHVGMAHHAWGQCGKHVEHTSEAQQGMKDAVDKAEDREERYHGMTVDWLAVLMVVFRGESVVGS